MISTILPACAAAADAMGHIQDATLFPEEAAIVGSAVAVRVRDFTTVRHLARRALAELGIAPAPILPGANREPIWPPGIVGSLTHCPGYCAATVARSAHLASVGIDAEPHEPLPEGILAMVAGRVEHAWMDTLAGGGMCWDRLLFSAKESIFKAWYPLTRRWLDFGDVTVTVDPIVQTFQGILHVAPPIVDGAALTAFDGRYLVSDGCILTAVALPRRRR